MDLFKLSCIFVIIINQLNIKTMKYYSDKHKLINHIVVEKERLVRAELESGFGKASECPSYPALKLAEKELARVIDEYNKSIDPLEEFITNFTEFYETKNMSCVTNSDLVEYVKEGIRTGVEWQKKRSPTYDDVSHAIAYAIHQSKLGLTHEQILTEYNKVHRK